MSASFIEVVGHDGGRFNAYVARPAQGSGSGKATRPGARSVSFMLEMTQELSQSVDLTLKFCLSTTQPRPFLH
jgi:carboxymethylenebutenolidase